MHRKTRHAAVDPTTLRPEMPSLRRMPPPSRLPEFDLDGAGTLASAGPPLRRPGLLRAVLDQLTGWTRRV